MENEKKWIREILRHGSRQAADALVRSYYDDIYAFVYRQAGNREDALDLTQECFLAALRALPSYDEKKAGLRTWLYHIAAHKVIDLRRKQKMPWFSIDGQEIVDQRDFEQEHIDNLQDRELLAKIEEMVRGADPQTQEIFRLRAYGEHSFPEIAAVMVQTEAKVKARYYRLIAKIRKELDQDGTR